MNSSTFQKEVDKKRHELEPFLKALHTESDRSIAVLVACWLDDLLEGIISASYIRDRQVKSIFVKGILQSFYAKIQIAYFSGLIWKYAYGDLMLIREIRNKFAHAIMADLKFDDASIVQLIDKFTAGCERISEPSTPRAKFAMVALQYLVALLVLTELLHEERLPHLVERLKVSA